MRICALESLLDNARPEDQYLFDRAAIVWTKMQGLSCKKQVDILEEQWTRCQMEADVCMRLWGTIDPETLEAEKHRLVVYSNLALISNGKPLYVMGEHVTSDIPAIEIKRKLGLVQTILHSLGQAVIAQMENGTSTFSGEQPVFEEQLCRTYHHRKGYPPPSSDRISPGTPRTRYVEGLPAPPKHKLLSPKKRDAKPALRGSPPPSFFIDRDGEDLPKRMMTPEQYIVDGLHVTLDSPIIPLLLHWLKAPLPKNWGSTLAARDTRDGIAFIDPTGRLQNNHPEHHRMMGLVRFFEALQRTPPEYRCGLLLMADKWCRAEGSERLLSAVWQVSSWSGVRATKSRLPLPRVKMDPPKHSNVSTNIKPFAVLNDKTSINSSTKPCTSFHPQKVASTPTASPRKIPFVEKKTGAQLCHPTLKCLSASIAQRHKKVPQAKKLPGLLDKWKAKPLLGLPVHGHTMHRSPKLTAVSPLSSPHKKSRNGAKKKVNDNLELPPLTVPRKPPQCKNDDSDPRTAIPQRASASSPREKQIHASNDATTRLKTKGPLTPLTVNFQHETRTQNEVKSLAKKKNSEVSITLNETRTQSGVKAPTKIERPVLLSTIDVSQEESHAQKDVTAGGKTDGTEISSIVDETEAQSRTTNDAKAKELVIISTVNFSRDETQSWSGAMAHPKTEKEAILSTVDETEARSDARACAKTDRLVTLLAIEGPLAQTDTAIHTKTKDAVIFSTVDEAQTGSDAAVHAETEDAVILSTIDDAQAPSGAAVHTETKLVPIHSTVDEVQAGSDVAVDQKTNGTAIPSTIDEPQTGRKVAVEATTNDTVIPSTVDDPEARSDALVNARTEGTVIPLTVDEAHARSDAVLHAKTATPDSATVDFLYDGDDMSSDEVVASLVNGMVGTMVNGILTDMSNPE